MRRMDLHAVEARALRGLGRGREARRWVSAISASLIGVGVTNSLLCLPKSSATRRLKRPCRPPISARTWRPGWLICIQTCAPRLRAATAHSAKGLSGVPVSSTPPPGPVSAAAVDHHVAGDDQPRATLGPDAVKIVQRRARQLAGLGHVLPSMAALARRLGRTLPLEQCERREEAMTS